MKTFKEWSSDCPYCFGPSEVHGYGLIVRKFVPAITNLGTTHKLVEGSWKMLRPLGNYNHSKKNVNAKIIKKPNKKEMVVVKDLQPGTEVLVDYTQQPDLQQPNSNWKE